MSSGLTPSPVLTVDDMLQVSDSRGDLSGQQAGAITLFLASLKDYIIRMLAGEDLEPMQLPMEPFLHVLDHVSSERLSELYNVTGTSDKLSLLYFLSTNNITMGGILAQSGITPFGMDANVTRFRMTVDEFFMQFPEYRLKKQLVLYVSPVLLLLGTLGNLFSFIVLRRKPLVKVSSYIYLASLAVIDTIVLYIGLMRVWLAEVTGLDFQDSGDWICKLSVVLGYVASDLSVWLIIAVTVERYIVVCFPFKASSMCNTNRARKVIAFLTFLMLAINFHFFWTSGLVKNGEHVVCQAAPRFHQLVEEVWPWVDAFIYSFFPFGIIMTLNVLIVREVTRARSKRLLMSGSDQAVYGMESSRFSSQSNGALTGQGHNSSSNARVNQERSKLTVLLLTVSFTFLLLTLPNSISLIITRFWNKRYANDSEEVSDEDYRRLAQFTLARTITELLMYANHSVNFFLYCATGHKFRQQVLSVVRAMCSRANIGRFNLGQRRSRAERRGDDNGDMNWDADGSSCGGATNVMRFGYSMSVRQSSATQLAGPDGLRVSPNTAGGAARHGLMGQSRRLSAYSNDADFSPSEWKETQYSAQPYSNGSATRLHPSEHHGEKPSRLELTVGGCQVSVGEPANGGGDRAQPNGRRASSSSSGFFDATRSHECYQMFPIGNAASPGYAASSSCMTRYASRSSGNRFPPDFCSNSHQLLGSAKCRSLEINGNNCCEKQTSENSKSLRSVSLFTKRSRGREDKGRTKQSNGCVHSNQSRTDAHSPPSRFKSSRSSNSIGGTTTNKGRGSTASCHGCKLHYYSNKRPKSNSVSAGSSAASHTRENEYVLLTPQMRWFAPASVTS